MALLVFTVFSLLASQCVAIVEDNATPTKIVDQLFLQKQIDLISLYLHSCEPNLDADVRELANTYSLEKNIDNYKNVTAVEWYIKIKDAGWQIPLNVPFNIYDDAHQFQAANLFHLLHSAKDYRTFYKTALYLREHTNPAMFVYVLSVAILNHPETQDVTIPPLYEVFPRYFHNSMIMSIAQRMKVQGKGYAKLYPETYLSDDNVVIRDNETVWPFTNNIDNAIAYFTNDYQLNALYHNYHLVYPFWLSGKSLPHRKLNRGEHSWFIHKQYLARYYLDRVSNDLGEIPEIDLDNIVYEGYQSGLSYQNGIPFPGRPNYFNLNQPQFLDIIERIKELENRIRDSIDIGHLLSSKGDKISLRTPKALDSLMNAIEGNVDSPNLQYYGNLVTLYKMLLGNSMMPGYRYIGGIGGLAMHVPSALELTQTAIRDPAFYMIWKRILSFVSLYQSQLPMYSQEELSLPGIKIEKVEVDKMVTYFEYAYLNVTNGLFLNEAERLSGYHRVSVLVQRPQLNHKKFNIRVHIKSNVAKKVMLRYYLAPKYDKMGYEIPLHKNTENFFQIDQLVYELPGGDAVIEREPAGNIYVMDRWNSATEVYAKAANALKGKVQFESDMLQFFNGFPPRMNLPKGRVGGLPLVLLVHLSDYRASSRSSGHGVNQENSFPLRFPLDRPLYHYQIEGLSNVYLGEVQVHHKLIPEIVVPFNH